jgi:hypothetical protein
LINMASYALSAALTYLCYAFVGVSIVHLIMMIGLCSQDKHTIGFKKFSEKYCFMR